jgi:hypothetical protein
MRSLQKLIYALVLLLASSHAAVAQTDSDLYGDFQFGQVATVSNPDNFDQYHKFMVTRTDDANEVGTFRWAWNQVKNSPYTGTHLIYFNIAGTAPHKITISSELGDTAPISDQDVIIDGNTQPGNGYTSALPKIIIDDQRAEEEYKYLFEFSSSSVEIKGIEIRSSYYLEAYSCDSIKLTGNVISLTTSDYSGYQGSIQLTKNIEVQGNIFQGRASAISNCSFFYYDYCRNILVGGASVNEGNIFNTREISIILYGSTDTKVVNNSFHSDMLLSAHKSLEDFQTDGNYYSKNVIKGSLWLSSYPIWIYYGVVGGGITTADIGRPIIKRAKLSSGGHIIGGTAEPNATIELFLSPDYRRNQPEVYIGTTTADASGNWELSNVNIPHAYADNGALLATATNSYNSTSILGPVFRPEPPLCDIQAPLGGSFVRNSTTGAIDYEMGDCASGLSLGCLQLTGHSFTRVVAATSTTYTDALVAAAAGKLKSQVTNPYEGGFSGKWRPEAAYTYNTGLQPEVLNSHAGTFSMNAFNWKAPANAAGTQWLAPSQTVNYSADGQALEERNLLGISSTVKLGYNNSVPYLSAQNAGYKEVFFESFENLYGGYLEDYTPFSSSAGVERRQQNASAEMYAHSGSYFLRLQDASFYTRALRKGNGLLAKVWVSSSALLAAEDLAKSLTLDIISPYDGSTILKSYGFSVVARSGKWVLCQVELSKEQLPFTVSGEFIAGLRASNGVELWIDDVRLQPKDALMTTYVYEPGQLKLLASFDDQHFGLYYQYNAEGKLLRKLIETERGLQTIQETQYNQPGYLR